MIEIPINPLLPKQNLTVILSGSRFRLRVLWNTREECWTLSLYTDAGVAIVTGCKIVVGWAPFKGHERTEGFPDGKFWIYNSGGSGDRIKRDNFGSGMRCRLIYTENSEIAAA